MISGKTGIVLRLLSWVISNKYLIGEIQMCPISVLGLNNNFYGSYSSNQVFFSELMSAFRNIGAVVYMPGKIKRRRL